LSPRQMSRLSRIHRLGLAGASADGVFTGAGEGSSMGTRGTIVEGFVRPADAC
jgi:hypothetical protein